MAQMIFLSYSRTDRLAAQGLAEDVRALGYALWLDEEIGGGQAWWDEVLRQIRSADIIVVALSVAALDSVACQREYEYAAALGKRILPICIADDFAPTLLPPALAAVQFVQWRPHDRASAFRLSRAFMSLPAAGAPPAVEPPPPPVPLSYLGDLRERVISPKQLGFAEQSALLLELKQRVRAGKDTDQLRALMQTLRDRFDLLATVAVELDLMLRTQDGTAAPQSAVPGYSSSLPRTSEIQPVAVGEPDSISPKVVAKTDGGRSNWPGLIKGWRAPIGIVALLVAGGLFMFRRHSDSPDLQRDPLEVNRAGLTATAGPDKQATQPKVAPPQPQREPVSSAVDNVPVANSPPAGKVAAVLGSRPSKAKQASTVRPSEGVARDVGRSDSNWIEASQTVRDEIVAVIERLDAAEIQAKRTLDMSGLKELSRGAYLEDYQRVVDELRAARLYKKVVLKSRAIESVRVNGDRRTARVRMTEVWEGTVNEQLTNRCVSAYRSVNPQEITLIAEDNTWRGHLVKFANSSDTPMKCP